METKVNALNEHHIFVRDLLTAYRQLPLLWDKTHPKRNDRYERSDAYETLLTKVREHYPDADEDFVRLKIQSLRNSFRKEHRKVAKSKETSNKPEDIYKPQLWYYNLLLFTVNDSSNESFDQTESPDGDEQNLDDIPVDKLCYWSLEHTALLINTYKLFPSLYAAAHPDYRSRQKRDDAIKQVTNELIRITGKDFKEHDILRKMRTLRGQFLRETVKIKHYKTLGQNYKSQWCFYEMLEFLRPEFNKLLKRKFNSEYNSDEDNENSTAKIKRYNDSDSDDSEEMIVISRETPQPEEETNYNDGDDDNNEDEEDDDDEKVNIENESDNFDNQHYDSDIFDTIARNVAYQLREMSKEQRCIAERLIRDVLYHGTMENLTAESKLVL